MKQDLKRIPFYYMNQPHLTFLTALPVVLFWNSSCFCCLKDTRFLTVITRSYVMVIHEPRTTDAAMKFVFIDVKVNFFIRSCPVYQSLAFIAATFSFRSLVFRRRGPLLFEKSVSFDIFIILKRSEKTEEEGVEPCVWVIRIFGYAETALSGGFSWISSKIVRI